MSTIKMQTVAGLLASASLVAAHGYVDTADIGGTTYTFYQPYTDPYTSPTPDRVSREIQGNGPVTDLSYQDIQCGGDTLNGISGSSPAKLTASVAAGATVDLFWTLWPESHVGPSITYMAKCENDDCTSYMPENSSVWFKVQEQGRTGTSDEWGTTAIMTDGGSISYTVPECIEAGQYLVRHEVIALHSAYSEGGAQFYPGCHQLTVTGGGSTSPADLVAFPGAYKADDAGILVDAYAAEEYTIPGPALFTCSGSSSSSSSSSTSSSSGSSSGSSAAVSSAAVTSTAAATTTATPATSSVDANIAAATTDAPDSDEDDGCDAEVTVTPTVTAAQPTATAATSADESGEDDGCDAETDDSTTVTTGAATSSDGSAADEGEDDACGEDAAATAATATPAQPTATGSAAASSGDDEDCDAEAEQIYARRFAGRYARGM